MSRFYDENNDKKNQKKIGRIYGEDVFTPDSFSGESYLNSKNRKNGESSREKHGSIRFSSDFTDSKDNFKPLETAAGGSGFDFVSKNAMREKPEEKKKTNSTDNYVFDRSYASSTRSDNSYPENNPYRTDYGKYENPYDYKPLMSLEEVEKEVYGENVPKREKEEQPEYEPLQKIKKPKMKKGGFKKFAAVLLAIIIISGSALGFLAWSKLGSIKSLPDSHGENKYISASELMKSDNVYNILILGTDKRQGDKTFRSDTMMLMSINKKDKTIKLTSFLRDTYVYIPARKHKARLNAACAYGGAQMVIDTIEYNYKIKIDSYVMLTFNAFRSVINGLGGVTLDISEKEAAAIKKDSNGKYSPSAGVQNCDGYLALWYARIRKLDSDVYRTSRQREVIEAVVKKALKTNPVKLLNMLDSVLPGITTDMLRKDIIKAGLWVLPCLGNSIEGKSIPDSGTWHDDSYYNIITDFPKNIKILKSFIYGD